MPVRNRIDLNKAGQQELELIEGIDNIMASRILEFRNTNGEFKSFEDLKSVPGIEGSKLRFIKLHGFI